MTKLRRLIRRKPVHRPRRTTLGGLLPGLAALAAFIGVLMPGQIRGQSSASLDHRVPLAEVRPGMTGYGLTVFTGTEPDTFRATVLGLQRGARAGGDVILVELTGQDLARTAVARGMSGSPVYLDDGRLLGAIAFGWPGALRPIAGLTPAGELDRVRDREPAHDVGAAAGPLNRAWDSHGSINTSILLDAMPPDHLAALLPAGADGQDEPFIASPTRPVMLSHDPWPTAEQLVHRLLPRLEPLRARSAGAQTQPGNLDGRLESLEPALYAMPAAGAPRSLNDGASAASSADTGPPALVPGSACAIALVSGDAHLGALGTVSLVEGRRVVLMAHPFMHFGPVDLPLAAASVVTLFPSRELSFKMGSAGPIVGRITHDLRAGLSGVLGERAPSVPVEVALELPGGSRTYRFETALQPELTPQLVFWCLYNALLAEGDDRSRQLVRFDISFRFEGRDGRSLPPVDLQGVTGGPGGVNAMQSDWQAPLQLLLVNRHEPLTLTGVTASLKVQKPMRTARIVWMHAPARIVPGEDFTVDVELVERFGDRRRERFTLRAPDNLQPGALRLGAASARDFFRLDALRAGGLFEDHSLGATLDLLNRPRSLDELTVALIAPGLGFTAGGRELSGLPPSVRHTLAVGPPGTTRPTMAAYLSRASRHTGYLLQGDAVTEIEVCLPPTPRAEGVRP